MSRHLVEMFTEDAKRDEWGFQCSTCGYEATGYEGLAVAEAAAEKHAQTAALEGL